MTKQLYILQNHLRETPGQFSQILNQYKIPYRVINLAKGEALPNLTGCNGLIVLGGSDSANDTSAKIQVELAYVRDALKLGLPYLGVCLGLQLLVKVCGGRVVLAPVPEHGLGTVNITAAGEVDPLLQGLDTIMPVFQLHNETVDLTPAMTLIGTGAFCTNQLVRVQPKVYGLQCHMEVIPALLADWLQHMPDLQQYNTAKLKQEFMAEYNTYERNGQRLILNWLRTAQLLTV